jgi:putative sigma-54 modulation protein
MSGNGARGRLLRKLSMRIDVVGKHLEVTPAIEKYASTKADKLLHIFDRTQSIKVVLDKQGSHEFGVEVVVDVERHEDFVAHAKHEDLYAAIDVCVDKAQRQLRDHKDKLRA